MIFVILLAVITIGFIWFIACYLANIEMNRGQNLPYDYVNFKTFKSVFNKYIDKYKDNPNIKIKYGWHGSPAVFMHMNYGYYNYLIYLHANIVKFENKCMIFYPFSYIKYCIWMRKFENGSRKKGLWKDN